MATQRMNLLSNAKLSNNLDSSPWELKNIKDQTEEQCILSVRKSGDCLKYVERKTPVICLEAVNQDGNALQHIEEQTEQICLTAVRHWDA